jgi:hypothetical protein
MSKILFLHRSQIIKADDGSDSCKHSALPQWFSTSINYPVYYSEDCLEKFDFDGEKFICKRCHSRAIYYRFDMAFENFTGIYLPKRIDLDLDILKKRGSPCLIIVHLFCCPFGDGCRNSWWMNGTQSMIEIIANELDEEWVQSVTEAMAFK